MDFDQLLLRHLGTTDLASLPQARLLAGVEQLRLQFEREDDADDRFAIWCLLYMLSAAPDIEAAFDDEDDRDAAREFADSIDEDDE
jgi:hypothetical protein